MISAFAFGSYWILQTLLFLVLSDAISRASQQAMMVVA
jgi:hypothetical protein